MNLRRMVGRTRRHPRVLGTEIRRELNLLRYRRVEWAIARRRATRIVEIGVHRADRSPRLVAAALKHSDHVDYWGFDLFAEMATPEVLESEAMPGGRPLSLDEATRLVERPGASVTMVRGDTREVLPDEVSAIGRIDVAFLDGGHSYETARSDWLALQPALHEDSVVFFDDYILGDAASALGCGVATVVDEIDRSRYRVRLLHPIDSAPLSRSPWIFRTRIAEVTMRQPGRRG